ncbi:MAG: hypothetical protein GF372_12665, partial [Candidatus Marinimicrobia bacterium]|nr:hypothetical protein [Candidatus Neomarinimicrobiota bacterium]
MPNIIKWSILLGVILFHSTVMSQQSSLWIPPNYQQVYDDSLHMYDGTAGPNYWQNRAEYDIQVEVDPAERLLSGQAAITYYNESPDTLSEIVLHFHQDVYKRGSLRDVQLPDSILHDGVQIYQIRIEGSNIDLADSTTYQRNLTQAVLMLPNSLMPGASLDLNISWEYTVPAGGLRTGFFDRTSAFIGYWYPQVAVYDAISGWDRLPYTGRYEFYQNFSDFTVAITLPDSFVVWGTGILQNPEEMLTPKYLRRYQQAQKSETVIRIADADAVMSHEVLKNRNAHTWKFSAENIPDFSFAFSDHHFWDGAQVASGNGQSTVFIQSGYVSDTTHFAEVVEMSQAAIRHFETVMPGVKYPHPTLFLFDGLSMGLGMEFPMMVNQVMYSEPAEYDRSVGVTFHEIAHMYFPFAVGINEKYFAWMDEGLAVYMPWEGQNAYADTTSVKSMRIRFLKDFYKMNVGTPIMGSSMYIRRGLYFTKSYNIPGMAFLVLEDLLGKTRMRKGLQEFTHRWQGKHPLPWDLFFTFNDVLEEDLSWFWQPWFYEARIPDIGLTVVEKVGSDY